jgi:hypothetical protein
MNFLKKSGVIVYLDLDKNIILDRANKMKLDRIVGQSTKSLSEILDYRREIYQKYYDIRVIVGDNEDAEVTCNNIIDYLNKDEEYTSTRGEKSGSEFLDVIREGLAKDGGLYVPKELPKLTQDQWKRFINMSYNERYR